MNYPDVSYEDCIARAQTVIDIGYTVYFKFTCEACGSRQTFERPNAIYVQGICEECKHITDLRKNGCGFMAMAGM